MELVDRELPKILKYYHVDTLGLIFDGYEWVNPDKILYYWHDPKNNDLYVALLADFIIEFSTGDAECRIQEDYWPENTCDWKVERWLCSSETSENDYADYDSWFYWPECGDKCTFAKLKADASALKGRNLSHDVASVSEEEMLARKARRDELTMIDSQAHS